MTYSVKGRAVSFGALLAVGGALLASYAFLLGILPEMNLVKEFNLSTVAHKFLRGLTISLGAYLLLL